MVSFCLCTPTVLEFIMRPRQATNLQKNSYINNAITETTGMFNQEVDRACLHLNNIDPMWISCMNQQNVLTNSEWSGLGWGVGNKTITVSEHEITVVRYLRNPKIKSDAI